MINLKQELLAIVDKLNATRIAYAICGGLAVAIHGYPRSTRDIDILISSEQLDAARELLRECGYDLDGGMIPFDIGKPAERRIYRVSKAEGSDLLTIDLMLVSPFLKDVWESRESHMVENHIVHVVSRQGLAKMKRAAGRPQDIADLAALGLDVAENL